MFTDCFIATDRAVCGRSGHNIMIYLVSLKNDLKLDHIDNTDETLSVMMNGKNCMLS